MFWCSDHVVSEKGYSSLLSFTVTDINTSISKLMELGAELDGSIKYEVHGKVKKTSSNHLLYLSCKCSNLIYTVNVSF